MRLFSTSKYVNSREMAIVYVYNLDSPINKINGTKCYKILLLVKVWGIPQRVTFWLGHKNFQGKKYWG